MKNQEERGAAQLMLDAFKVTGNIIETYDDLLLIEKNGLWYTGDEDNFFVGGFPEWLTRQYYENRKMEKLVTMAHEDPEELENLITLAKMESAEEEYRNSAFTVGTCV